MPITLDNVVPWGRSYDEYVAMFDLSPGDLAGRILGCGDGPASFNSEATQRGRRVISCDPIYRFSAAEIQSRIQATYDNILNQLRRDQSGFVWDVFQSPEELGQVRLAAMGRFLDDYPKGKTAGRYQCATLPHLPFADRTFDLALCSHFLFLYSGQLSLDFHLAAVRDMARVASEVRIFPLLDMGCVESPYVASMIEVLQPAGYQAEVVEVPYEFQIGGNMSMRIRKL